MSKEIDRYIANIKIISDEVRETFGGLSAAQLNWKPNAKSWSIGQCFDHLITTNSEYFPKIQKVADGTHENNWFSAIPFLPDFIGKMLKKAVNPDSLKKMKNPPVFTPSGSEISETILEDFYKNLEEMISLMEAVKHLDTRKIKIATPVSDAVNIRLNDAFEASVMHNRRHFNQAKRVMEMKEFPR
jgi:Asp-tRNA(Asn)/Glu-tRNA(Gln) amidotransferase C subunit